MYFVVFTSGNAASRDHMVPVLLRTVLSSRLFLVWLMNKSFSSGVFCYITQSKHNSGNKNQIKTPDIVTTKKNTSNGCSIWKD